MVILYAEIGTKDFVKFHKILSEKAQKEEIVYVLRHYVQVCNQNQHCFSKLLVLCLCFACFLTKHIFYIYFCICLNYVQYIF